MISFIRSFTPAIKAIGIRACLFPNRKGNRLHAVERSGGLRLDSAVFDPCDVFDFYRVIVARRDDDFVEIFNVFDFTQSAQRNRARAFDDEPPGDSYSAPAALGTCVIERLNARNRSGLT
jgi:hypothetical protein